MAQFKNIADPIKHLTDSQDQENLLNEQEDENIFNEWKNSILTKERTSAAPREMASWLKDAPLRKLDETQIKNLLTQKDEYGNPYDEAILRRMAKHVQKYEPLSEKYATDIENLTNTLGGQMVGLEYRLKRPTSLYRKVLSDIAEQKQAGNLNYGIEDALKGMRDVSRFTVALNGDDNFGKNVIGYMDAMKKLGYIPTKFKNSMLQDSLYKGVNTNFRDPEGNEFELQFHTPESMLAKEGIRVDLQNRKNVLDHSNLTSHNFYEKTRILDDLKRNGNISPRDLRLLEILNERNKRHWDNVRNYPDLAYIIEEMKK